MRFGNDRHQILKLDLYLCRPHTPFVKPTHEAIRKMSTSFIATLPRSGGNGRAFFSIVGDVLKAMFASRYGQGMNPVQEMGLWDLYRLTAGYDSISPKVAAELRRKLVGN
jgi:hypothetical protein